ncbi:UPF0104 family protein [Rhodococcus rhodnii]|uniref:Uncharacterized protein n=2 Tax=Rhodococcus rhodnii TaxID=38312 RepID=R7WHX5_9NOCA|nr:YbhN family protein [Rhodococcus rhodnii]EOM74702.1 hypothetical protein Rrhod_3969 [Rhodococcus rhodnii LMG 5362]TXG88932.1 UPF0104 family protein [Rhodococcus rhodnii]
MTDDPPSPAARSSRRRALRWGIGAVLVVVLTVEIVLIWPELSESVMTLGDIRWGWLAAAIVASVVSMTSFASVQRTLLGVADVIVRQRQSLSVAFAANSISVTLPGGPLIAATFTYQATRRWGASPVVASWQLVMAGALQAIGLAVIGIGGTLLVGAAKNPFSLLFSAAAMFAFVVLAQYAASRPGALEGVGVTAIRMVNRVRKLAADHGVDRWHRIVEQIGAVRMSRADGARSLGWSLLNWIADAACLAFACYAIGGAPSLAGLAVAYAASNAAKSAIPLLPAGLGVMDAVLVPTLTAAGMTGAQALSAIVVYRLVSFVLVAVIGWIVFAMRFRGQVRAAQRREHEDDDKPPMW